MSQDDYTIADQDGASFLVDINNQLAAIVSNNSGATEPTTTYAYQWWADTSSGLLKIRNAANSAWVTIGTLGSANLGLLALAGGTLTGALNEAQGADIASAGTVNLTTATGNYIHITGTTTITAITLEQGAGRTVVFDGALTLTNGSSLLLPTAANITTVAGDTAVFRGEAAGVVRCVSYIRKDGTSISSSSYTAGDGITISTGIISSKIYQKLITDSTDILLNNYATPSYSNVGSSFTLNIPTNGVIRFASFSGRVLNNATATQHGVVFGIRIGTTNYWFTYLNTDGTVSVQNQLVCGTTASIFVSWNGFSGSNAGEIDVSAYGLPTGSQTVQLIAAYQTTQSTLKGTTSQTRVTLEILG